MRKSFTLAILTLALAVSAYAEESIMGASTWSPWNPEATTIEVTEQYTAMTFTESWSGAGYWMGIDEDDDGETDFYADWSDYDFLVYVVSDARGTFNLCIEYADFTNPSDNHATSGSIGTNGYGFVPIDADWSDYVKQTWIQPTAPGSVVITDMVLMTSEEFEAFKQKMMPTGDIVNIWKGEMNFDNSWPAISIAADAFSMALEGDKMIVTVSEITQVDGWDWGTQLFCNNGAWRSMPGSMKIEGISEPGEYTLNLTQEQLDTIAATGGIKLQGMACKVTSVDLMKSEAVVGGTVLWEGKQVFDLTWPGIQGMGPEKFADAKVGDKIVVTVESVDALDDWAWGAQLMWKNGANWEELAGTSTTTVSAPGDVALNIGAETLAALKESGLILGGIACTVTKIMLVPSITHVDTVVAQPMADEEIYNLCGQRVDASYKGLVIRGGKKFLNR